MRTPVGNPELWEVNRVATNYNAQVRDFNSTLRDNPDNLDSRGHLKRGRKLHDGMDIYKPPGYVGGRLRGNWNVSLGAANYSTTTTVDPSGSSTLQSGRAALATADGEKDVWIVNGLPYALPIEYGHSKQAPAGMVRVSVTEFPAYVNTAAEAVSRE